MADLVQKRRELRRLKILANKDNRMKKIMGHHDGNVGDNSEFYATSSVDKETSSLLSTYRDAAPAVCKI